MHPDPRFGNLPTSFLAHFGWHVRYHVIDGKVQFTGCGLWNIGETWDTLSSHAELAAGLRARIVAFRLHTPRYMCITRAVHIFIAHRVTYHVTHRFHDIFVVQFSFVFVLRPASEVFLFLALLAWSRRDRTFAVTLWKKGMIW